MAQGVPDRLRPRIFLTFRYYKDGSSSAKCTGRLYPSTPGSHFQRLTLPQGTWFCRGYHGKKFLVTPLGIDPGTVLLVAQRLNHYATPGPNPSKYKDKINNIKFQLLPHREQSTSPSKDQLIKLFRGLPVCIMKNIPTAQKNFLSKLLRSEC